MERTRIGFGLGVQDELDGERFDSLIDALEGLGFDSIWLSERLTAGSVNPVVGLAYAAGRTRKLKLGTSVMVLPGRNPVLLAKELASLDRLSNGRHLPAFGLGVADPFEQQAFGVARQERAKWFDEALPLIRRLWAEDHVDHEGERFTFHDLTVQPKPIQSPMDVWLGGMAPSELRRVGRLGDGWLPSTCTPQEAAAGRQAIEAAAADAGRTMDPGHWGASITYVEGEIPQSLVQRIARRRPDLDPADVFPQGHAGTRQMIERFVDVGFTKFVVRPARAPASWADELRRLGDVVLPLQVAHASPV